MDFLTNMKISSSGDIVAYDFGIMGRIDEYTRRVYAEILIGFINPTIVGIKKIFFFSFL